MEIKKCSFVAHGDSRGQLVALEEYKEVPFEVKRVYYIYDTLANVRRGFHAHKDLEQVLVCVNGSCKILVDDGKEKAEVELSDPCEGLYIGNNIWREMYDFSPDAVLLVLASKPYDERDYIRDYTVFLDSLD